MKSVSINPDAACTPTAARPFRVEESYCTLFESPIFAGIGSNIGLFLAGSYLIEKIFGIDGIGLLTFKAIGTRDYAIIMGFLVIGVLIRLFGNLISDLCYALIDPRIRFK